MTMASLGANSDTSAGHFSQASLLGGSSATTEGLPLFQEALDRIADACVPAFEKLAGDDMTVTCALASLTSESAGDLTGPLDPTMTVALLETPLIGSRLMVTLEDPFLQLVIELMCGGMCGEPVSATTRPGTSIDRQFARVIFNLLSTLIAKECGGLGIGGVIFGQIETKLDPLALGKRNTKVSVATFTLECLGRRGNVRIAFPAPVLDRFKQDSLPASKKEAVVDPEWTERLKAEIGRTVVKLDAFLDGETLTLGEVATLRIGQTLALPKTAPSRCELRCDDKLLFRCELGQADGHYSLRIDETMPRKTATAGASKPAASPFFKRS